jgi:hypothetical protein
VTGLFAANHESICTFVANHEYIGKIDKGRSKVDSCDIIDYLKRKGVELLRMAESYETILKSKIGSNPIVIEYSVERHEYEDPT